MEAVYLSLRLKGKRKSSKENWRDMPNLGHTAHAGHQNAVSVVFQVIKGPNVPEGSHF